MEKHSTPVLVQHGYTMSATSWVESNFGETPWPLQLADRGYDVWLSSTRGTTYSNTNEKDGQWSDEDRWDFSWADMGKYDQPANIKKILEVTGKEKLTYIGYSQGNQQMIYGLGTDFEFFREHLRDAIFVAPCIYMEDTYDGIVNNFLGLKQAGFYVAGGEQWPDVKREICDKLPEEQCTYFNYWPDQIEAAPFKSQQYTKQNYVEDQFAEPIQIEDYARGQRDSPAIDLGVIDDSFPITFIIGDQDKVCTPQLAERIFDEFTNADKTKRYEEGFDHAAFISAGSQDFVDRMVESIEAGGARYHANKDDKDDSMMDIILVFLMAEDGATSLLATSAVALTTLALAF